MAKGTAWVLDLGSGLQAAVGEREMLHLVGTPELIWIPQTLAHCQHVLIWHDTMLPVMDLESWLCCKTTQSYRRFVAIIAFQERPGGSLHYGGLLLTRIPLRISVSDDQACDLPKEPTGWKNLAISCFTNGQTSVPILDLPLIFSTSLPEF